MGRYQEEWKDHMTEIGMQKDAPVEYLLQHVAFHWIYDDEVQWTLAGKSTQQIIHHIYDMNNKDQNQFRVDRLVFLLSENLLLIVSFPLGDQAFQK